MSYIGPQFPGSCAAQSDTKKSVNNLKLVFLKCMLLPKFLFILPGTGEEFFHSTLLASRENQISSEAKNSFTTPYFYGNNSK